MTLGATIDGAFVEMSSVGLRNKMRTDPTEATRKACWEGLRSIGDFVTANGFVELVKARNRMAKALGYIDSTLRPRGGHRSDRSSCVGANKLR